MSSYGGLRPVMYVRDIEKMLEQLQKKHKK
jgi:hypothetical protein